MMDPPDAIGIVPLLPTINVGGLLKDDSECQVRRGEEKGMGKRFHEPKSYFGLVHMFPNELGKRRI